MSTGGSKPSRVVLQNGLFGGVDVVELFTGSKRNILHCSAPAQAQRYATELAVRDGAQLVHLDELPPASVCPKCGHSGPTDVDFGTRVLRGRRVPQSWCRPCRLGRAR